MKFIVLVCAIGLAAATPVHVGHVASQYHAQDELGQYSYGYSGGPSAKHETKTADGVTRGGYSYIDAHGLVQSAEYVSDSHNGFRVAATNLPVGPAVPAAPAVVAAAPAVVAPSIVSAPVVASAPAVVSAGLPEVIAARSFGHSGLISHSVIPSVYGAHSWSGLVHALKKRSIALVPTYTNFPASTGPLVHAAPAVIAHSPIVAHSAVIPTAYSSWGGLTHVLKKRSLALIASPLTSYPGSTAPLALASPVVAYAGHAYAAPALIAGPLEHPHVAAAKTAHLIQHHNEAVRNTVGIGAASAWSPADTPEVAITKHAHLVQQAHEAIRNTHGLVKRSVYAPIALSAPVVTSHSTVLTHSPIVHGYAYNTAPVSPILAYGHHW